MTSDESVDVVRAIIEAIGALDIDAALSLTTDDFVLELPFRGDGGPRRLEGDDARAFMRMMPRVFSVMPMHDIVVHGALPGGHIVAEYRSEGMTRSGREYRNTYIAIFEVRDGRVAMWREYFDPNVVAQATNPVKGP